jgi:hypothetical protein
MDAEALERAGEPQKAIDLFVRSAVAEEDAQRPLRARLLWEEVAKRTGPTAALLERLARVCGRAHLNDEAFGYWVAATALFRSESRTEDAEKAAAHAMDLKRRLSAAARRNLPALAQSAIGSGESVQDLLGE